MTLYRVITTVDVEVPDDPSLRQHQSLAAEAVTLAQALHERDDHDEMAAHGYAVQTFTLEGGLVGTCVACGRRACTPQS